MVALKYQAAQSKLPLIRSFLEVLHLFKEQLEKLNFKIGMKADLELLMRYTDKLSA